MIPRIQSFIAALSLMLVSFPGYALYFSWDGETLANASLKGVKTLVVDVDPPVRLMKDELKNYGVTETDLNKKYHNACVKPVSISSLLNRPRMILKQHY